MTSFTPVLRRLALPLYLPTLAQGAGFTALAPVLPLLALDLGFSVPASAALGLITGVLGVVGPMPAGPVVVATLWFVPPGRASGGGWGWPCFRGAGPPRQRAGGTSPVLASANPSPA